MEKGRTLACRDQARRPVCATISILPGRNRGAVPETETSPFAPDRSIFQAVGFTGVERCPAQAVLPLVGLAAGKIIRDRYVFQAVGFTGVERCPAQAVLPLVGLAADQVIRDRYVFQAVGFTGVERCPAQAVLPLVGLAAGNVIRDRCIRQREL